MDPTSHRRNSNPQGDIRATSPVPRRNKTYGSLPSLRELLPRSDSQVNPQRPRLTTLQRTARVDIWRPESGVWSPEVRNFIEQGIHELNEAIEQDPDLVEAPACVHLKLDGQTITPVPVEVLVDLMKNLAQPDAELSGIPVSHQKAMRILGNLHEVLGQVDKGIKTHLRSQAAAPGAVAPSSAGVYLSAMAGGAAGYLTSFWLAKTVGTLCSLAGAPLVGAGLFPAVASLCNVLLSEPIAGAIRAGHGVRPTPDGTAFANYATAQAHWLSATIAGNAQEAQLWDNRCQSIVNNLFVNHRDLAVPAALQSEAHPIAMAWLRSLLSDELPFLSFTVLYAVVGSMIPLMRQLPSTPGGTHVAALVDWAAYSVAGTLSGAMTAVGQTRLRWDIQGAEAVAGPHHPAVTEHRRAAERQVNQELRARREAMDVLARTLFTRPDGPSPEQEQRVEAMAQYARQREFDVDIGRQRSKLNDQIALSDARLNAWVSPLGPTERTVYQNLVTTFGEPDPKLPWLEGSVQARRVASKALGYSLSLAGAAYMLVQLADAVQSAGRDDWSPESANRVITIGTTFGVPLIVGWNLRSALTAGFEHAIGVLVGLGQRLTGAGQPQEPAEVGATGPVDQPAAFTALSEVVVVNKSSDEENPSGGEGNEPNVNPQPPADPVSPNARFQAPPGADDDDEDIYYDAQEAPSPDDPFTQAVEVAEAEVETSNGSVEPEKPWNRDSSDDSATQAQGGLGSGQVTVGDPPEQASSSGSAPLPSFSDESDDEKKLDNPVESPT